MNILVINCGSSTVKFRLIDAVGEYTLAAGCVDRIGSDVSTVTFSAADRPDESSAVAVPNHDEAVRLIVERLGFQATGAPDHTAASSRCLNRIVDAVAADVASTGAVSAAGGRAAAPITSSPAPITAIGHRVVHGADVFSDSVLITDRVIEQIERCVPLAPLHNPHNLSGILACRRLLPAIPQIAVFDTAFHANMPIHAATYALPRALAEKHRIRRYGFHGTSHRYVSGRTALLMGRSEEAFRAITCHLGNGASVTAVQNGRSVDTSMGMTPLEGLIMGTRCGDIDPSIPFYLMHTAGLSADHAERILNRESGLAGISGGWTDMRDLLRLRGQGDERAKLAIDMYAYRVKKYIGAYAAALGGADAIAFTGGVGENVPFVRSLACSGLEYMGISLDQELNQNCAAREARISEERSPVEVWVVPTNEELIIARETAKLCR